MKAKKYVKLLLYGNCDVNEIIRNLAYNHPKKAKKVITLLQNEGNHVIRVFLNLVALGNKEIKK